MAEENTPPENPFEMPSAAIDSNDGANGNVTGEETLSQGAPEVAAKNGKTFIILGLMVAIVLFLLYSIFFGGDKNKDAGKVKQLNVAPKSLEPPPLPIAEPAAVVPLPTIQAPSIPEPIQVPENLNLNPITPKDDSAEKSQALARLRSSMLIKDGADGGGLSALTGSTPAATPTDPNSQFAANLATTKVERVEATRIGNLRRTIAQGRIIQATMESAWGPTDFIPS